MKNFVIAFFVALIIVAIIKRSAIMEGIEKLKGIVTRSVFINHYKDAVKQVTRGTGLFPSLMMAQFIIESSDKQGNPGNSSLFREYNNGFGIKADKSWKGKKVNLQTREVFDGKDVTIGDNFRVYPTVLEGFKDRISFLQQNARYKNAGVFSAATPERQAQALKDAGYATDPNYANTLISIITKNNLKSLDA